MAIAHRDLDCVPRNVHGNVTQSDRRRDGVHSRSLTGHVDIYLGQRCKPIRVLAAAAQPGLAPKGDYLPARVAASFSAPSV